MTRIAPIICAALITLIGVAAADQPPPELPDGTYRLVEVHVVVADTEPNGDSWDEWPRKMADPAISVKVDGVLVHECLPALDTHDVTCVVNKDVKLTANSSIELVVTDFDAVTDDDHIGDANRGRELRPSDLTGPYTMSVSGQLVSATVTLAAKPKPVAKNKPAGRDGTKAEPAGRGDGNERAMNMWDASRYRFIGIGVGIAAGLLVSWLFAGFLWPPDEDDGLATAGPRDVVKIRCPFCGALNDESADSCHKCNGDL